MVSIPKRSLFGVVAFFHAFALAGPSTAQIPGLEAWAEAIEERWRRPWPGPWSAPPTIRERPETRFTLLSTLRPLAVHAATEHGVADAAAALSALEQAYDVLTHAGWPPIRTDGGRGGTSEFDLYLAQTSVFEDEAASDGRFIWTPHDAVSSFAIVDPRVMRDRLAACVTSAYAQALLMQCDPAESLEWRRATAAALTLRVTGELGCGESAPAQQRSPWRSWIEGGADGGAGGGAWLAMLDDGLVEGGLYFLWEAAMQSTRLGTQDLRGRPTLWDALRASRSPQGFAELARAGGIYRVVGPRPAILTRAEVPRLAQVRYRDLPVQTAISPPIEPFGSAYAEVQIDGASQEDLLRVWMRAEDGAVWATTVLGLDAHANVIRRIDAPVRTENHAYVPLALGPPIAHALVAVTHVADVSSGQVKPGARAFRVILDR